MPSRHLFFAQMFFAQTPVWVESFDLHWSHFLIEFLQRYFPITTSEQTLPGQLIPGQIMPAQMMPGAGLTIRLVDQFPMSIACEAEPLLHQDSLLTIRGDWCRFVLGLGHSRLYVDVAKQEAVCFFDVNFKEQPGFLQRKFFTQALISMLSVSGYHALHANALVPSLAQKKAGVLVCGHSGSGKTTLSLGLFLAGWYWVGDDLLVLRREAQAHKSDDPETQEVIARSTRRGVSCTEQTLDFFPQLKALDRSLVHPMRRKYQLDLDRYFPTQMAPLCRPRLLLFPQIAKGEVSHFVRLTALETLLALMPQGFGVALETNIAIHLMPLLAALQTQTHSYRVLVGDDLFQQPGALAAGLEQLSVDG